MENHFHSISLGRQPRMMEGQRGTSGTELYAPCPAICTPWELAGGGPKPGGTARHSVPPRARSKNEGRSFGHVAPLSPAGPAWASSSI